MLTEGLQVVATSGVDFMAWDIDSFLKNAATTLQKWFNAGVIILGLIAILYSVIHITTGLMSNGKKPVNWGIAIGLLIIGGALVVANGFDFVKGIAEGGRDTIKDLGGQK